VECRLILQEEMTGSSGTNVAPGMDAAIRRPWSKLTMASPRAWHTSVGTLQSAKAAETSISPDAVCIRTAFAGEVVIRWSSLNQR
jgi:hypothetical protein